MMLGKQTGRKLRKIVIPFSLKSTWRISPGEIYFRVTTNHSTIWGNFQHMISSTIIKYTSKIKSWRNSKYPSAKCIKYCPTLIPRKTDNLEKVLRNRMIGKKSKQLAPTSFFVFVSNQLYKNRKLDIYSSTETKTQL